MIIALAADHAGFVMKEYIREYLIFRGYGVDDVGAFDFDPTDDYPEYMHPLAAHLLRTPDSVGVIFGGSGQGEAIVANRYPGIRAIVCPAPDPDIVILGRRHNDANVLSIGSRFLTNEEAREAVDVFISTPFSHQNRHTRRIRGIERRGKTADIPWDDGDMTIFSAAV